MYQLMLWLSIILSLYPLYGQGETRITIADFENQGLQGWSDKIFKGLTQYKLIQLEHHKVLMALSRNSASGKVKKQRIDLKKTPYLHWNWRLDKLNWPQALAAETHRSGDDYALRIYVIVSGGSLFWRTKAINYVWSRHQKLNSHWPNAYSKNAAMLAVETGGKNIGKWRHYQRDVVRDFDKLFGIRPKEIHAVAIMTDTDNTGAQIEAYYGNIYFSDQ